MWCYKQSAVQIFFNEEFVAPAAKCLFSRSTSVGRACKDYLTSEDLPRSGQPLSSDYWWLKTALLSKDGPITIVLLARRLWVSRALRRTLLRAAPLFSLPWTLIPTKNSNNYLPFSHSLSQSGLLKKTCTNCILNTMKQGVYVYISN